jgi:hypothetical protein
MGLFTKEDKQQIHHCFQQQILRIGFNSYFFPFPIKNYYGDGAVLQARQTGSTYTNIIGGFAGAPY